MPLPRLLRGLALAALLGGGLAPRPALASDSAAGAAPLGVGLVLLGLGGGIATSVLLGQAVADGERVPPALRNIGFTAGKVNLALGITGVLAAAFTDNDEYDTVIYGISAGYLALGLTGISLALAADPYDPDASAVMPALGPGQIGAVWVGRF